jgi:diacylglycerol kinase
MTDVPHGVPYDEPYDEANGVPSGASRDASRDEPEGGLGADAEPDADRPDEAAPARGIPQGIQDHRGLRGLGASFRYALEGFYHTIQTQRSMRIHLVVAVLVLIGGVLIRLNRTEWAIVAICIGLVLASELLNTALEAIVDIAAPTFNLKAKIAKDAAAAAVFVFAVVSVIVGLLVFITALDRLMS